MTTFLKAAAIVVMAVILGATIGKSEKDIAVVLTAAVCCIIAIFAVQMLSDVIAFLWKISNFAVDQRTFTGILLRISGVALITETVGLICADAGSSSLEKVMNFLGSAVILSLSLPFFESFLDIVQEILNVI